MSQPFTANQAHYTVQNSRIHTGPFLQTHIPIIKTELGQKWADIALILAQLWLV